jgi:membrane protein
MKFRALKELITGTFNEWMANDTSKLAASLAFYTLFSLAPILMILLAVVGVLYGEDTAIARILDRSQLLLGSKNAQIVETILQSAHENSRAATIVGSVGVIFGATAVFASLQDALNSIWGVTPKPGWNIGPYLLKRFFSFLIILGLGIVLILSFIATTAVAAVQKFATDVFPIATRVLAFGDFIVWLTLLSICFGVIYKVVPDVRIQWPDVWIGAISAAVLFTIGKTLIGIYLTRSNVASPFGAAGSLAVFLLWLYYSAHIFLLCGEFTQVYARRRGPGIIPNSHAVRVVRSLVA